MPKIKTSRARVSQREALRVQIKNLQADVFKAQAVEKATREERDRLKVALGETHADQDLIESQREEIKRLTALEALTATDRDVALSRVKTLETIARGREATRARMVEQAIEAAKTIGVDTGGIAAPSLPSYVSAICLKAQSLQTDLKHKTEHLQVLKHDQAPIRAALQAQEEKIKRREVEIEDLKRALRGDLTRSALLSWVNQELRSIRRNLDAGGKKEKRAYERLGQLFSEFARRFQLLRKNPDSAERLTPSGDVEILTAALLELNAEADMIRDQQIKIEAQALSLSEEDQERIRCALETAEAEKTAERRKIEAEILEAAAEYKATMDKIGLLERGAQIAQQLSRIGEIAEDAGVTVVVDAPEEEAPESTHPNPQEPNP